MKNQSLLRLFALSALALAYAHSAQALVAADWQYVEAGLVERKVPTVFIRPLRKKFDREDALDILEKNLFGFLRKANYEVHLGGKSVPKSKAFLKQYAKTLKIAEKKYGVDRYSITSLLWVETHLGKGPGVHPIASTYLAMALGPSEDFQNEMLKLYRKKYSQGRPDLAADELLIKTRLKSKAEWALDQLAALHQIQGHGYKNVYQIKGSYAGAFGIAQFIPESYLKWSVSHQEGQAPNLFRVRDAILSVAEFLKSNGWHSGDREKQISALMEYNRARGYAEVILKLAEQLGKKPVPIIMQPTPSGSPRPAVKPSP